VRRPLTLLALFIAALLTGLTAQTAPAETATPDDTQSAAVAARTVACRGSANDCRARVSLAGGASNEQVVIRLTDTDLRLVSVKPNRRFLRGAYLVSNGRFRLGGSEYVFTLNAVGSIRVGSYLVFTFRA
jgi:hypothetical protein